MSHLPALLCALVALAACSTAQSNGKLPTLGDPPAAADYDALARTLFADATATADLTAALKRPSVAVRA